MLLKRTSSISANCSPAGVFSGEEISTDYDHDEMTIYGHYMPEAVLQALTTEDVSAVLKYCNEHNIAVTPRGAGTACAAAVWPSTAAWCSPPRR